jgi:hypothetical protein
MKIMAKHSSATAHCEKPHVLELSRTNTIMNALKQRARALVDDPALDEQSRAILRYGLETNDPWLAELVRRADAEESIVDKLHCSRTPETNEIHSERKGGAAPDANEDTASEHRVEVLAEIICGAGDEAAGALFVLMGMLENSTERKAVVNTLKHLAFSRCGELNLFGIVDAQIAVLAGELLARNRLMS